MAPQHIRKRSVPFGDFRRAFIGDVVLAIRRTPECFHFLDAQVLDVGVRRGRAAREGGCSEDGNAGLRSELAVQLAYPQSQLYHVMEENETPRVIARKFGLALADVLTANAHLCQDEAQLQPHSKLRKGTEIALPPFPESLHTEATAKMATNGIIAPGCVPHATSQSAVCYGVHWDLEYLVQYLHGGHDECGSKEWLRPELIFQTHAARIVVPVPCAAGACSRAAPTKVRAV